MGIGTSLEIKRPEIEVDYSPTSSAEVKNEFRIIIITVIIIIIVLNTLSSDSIVPPPG
jgi:hypothetical protein